MLSEVRPLAGKEDLQTDDSECLLHVREVTHLTPASYDK